MNVKFILLGLILALPAQAQGFAGLGQGGDGFALPVPGRVFEFPEDHGAHPDYRIEWWYLTAALEDVSGIRYGVQWTLFRSALTPEGPQVWMGHFGLTSPEEHFSGERFARGGVGQAGVVPAPFDAWIDDWRLSGPTLESLRLRAATEVAGYDLALRAEGPLVFHGDAGFSVKSAAGQASYYYSQPFYTVSGTLDLPSGPVEVTGRGWLDREWSSQPLQDDQEGWDWFSLHLDDGARLMAFGLRGGEGFRYASHIAPDGTLTPYYGDALGLDPLRVEDVDGREVPVDWQVRLPEEGIDLTVRAVNDDSWQATIFPYWEGPVIAEGSHAGTGFLEMTGYE